jgi:hypothetical protein
MPLIISPFHTEQDDNGPAMGFVLSEGKCLIGGIVPCEVEGFVHIDRPMRLSEFMGSNERNEPVISMRLDPVVYAFAAIELLAAVSTAGGLYLFNSDNSRDQQMTSHYQQAFNEMHAKVHNIVVPTIQDIANISKK